MIIQTILHDIPAAVFLNGTNKSIAFEKHRTGAFIDRQQDGQQVIEAVWSDSCVTIGEGQYDYKTWYCVGAHADLRDYFKQILADNF